jgi:6-phosphogluconolactonase
MNTPPPTIRILADGEAVAAAAANEILAVARGPRGAGIALAGGTTPRRAYQLVAAATRPGEMAGLHVWFGDERMVPPDHPDSNFAMIDAAWLAVVAERPVVHRIPGELGAVRAAALASDELRAVAGDAPRLDLAVLGLGTDVHTASLFPGDPAAEAAGLFVPARNETRVTATRPLLSAARRIVFIATGAAKAEAVALALAGLGPAGGIHGPDIVWLLDPDAATRVTPSNVAGTGGH